MVDLLKKDQNVMLGPVVNPIMISPPILVCHKKSITRYPLPTLPLYDDDLEYQPGDN